jgi:hypothetical protein
MKLTNRNLFGSNKENYNYYYLDFYEIWLNLYQQMLLLNRVLNRVFMNIHSMARKLNRKFISKINLNMIRFFPYRTQSMSDHFTKILSRMELNDLRSEDSIENSNDDERRIVNGNKNTFGTFFEQMR